MDKKKLLTTALTAALLSIGTAKADGHDAMEKCKITDKGGKGVIKEHKGDCAGGGNSCAGHNPKGDPNAWILVPKGACDKINKAVKNGDCSSIPSDIKKKLDI